MARNEPAPAGAGPPGTAPGCSAAMTVPQDSAYRTAYRAAVRATRNEDPPVRHIPGARDRVAALLAAGNARIVVIDDDPTGGQTVRGVPLITTWRPDDLRWALTRPERVAFVLTNSRALARCDAEKVAMTVGRRLAETAGALGCQLRVVSRSDSTLRGHFPAEIDALRRGLSHGGQAPWDGVLLCPAFPEAGRITVDDIHWVDIRGTLRPAACTEFAADPVFGYTEPNLCRWAEDRLAAPEGSVASLSLAELRRGGPSAVRDRLKTISPGQVIVANAAATEDLEILAVGLAEAETAGARILVRCGPSFVGPRGGLPAGREIAPSELWPRRPGHGLIVVGSHTALTTRQLAALRERRKIPLIELDINALAENAVIEHTVRQLRHALGTSDAILATSRTPARYSVPAEQLTFGHRVADAIARITRAVTETIPLRYIVAKGGITAHEIASEALRIRRAYIAGTLLPGLVSVWRPAGGPGKNEGLLYAVFPGNVGDDQSLVAAFDRLGA